jgi:hypothetical protein
MKKITRIVIALVFAAILFVLLYAQIYQASRDEKIMLVDVVVAKNEVVGDDKISAEDVEIKSKRIPEEMAHNYITELNDVVNKYAKETLHSGELIHIDSVKAIQGEKPTADVREVRITTNVAAYSGVGKGDKVDLIYVDKMGALETVGKLLYEGLEVKSVLNRSGVDLERIVADKYNQANLDPGYVVFWVSQKMALEIETLQGTSSDVVFKLAKWTDHSEKTNTDSGVQTKESIIFNKNGQANETEEELLIEIGGGE